MKIWSESFRNGAPIPSQFAFAAIDPVDRVLAAPNRNPHLAWSEVPAGTESLVLLCIDGDAPQDGRNVNRAECRLGFELPRTDFFHWSVIDIPPQQTAIAAGALAEGVQAGGRPNRAPPPLRQGLNDYTEWLAGDVAMAGDYYGYDGPCPPWNDLRMHHYIFRLYALDVARLALPARFRGADVCAAIHGHIIDEAQWIGTYTLNPSLSP
ncbi:MAG: YbhB/YbcL family Raf kinase inhibitor-like protein [Sphingomonadaceae bacterium]